MPSPTKPSTPRDTSAQNARLQAQLAELEAQRDELIKSMLPLLPAGTLPTQAAPASSSKSSNKAAEQNHQHLDRPSDSQDSGVAIDGTSTTAMDQSKSSVESIESISTETRTAVLDYANGVVKKHISLLHAYNGIRDVGQGLMGLIAEQRGVRVKDVMADFGVGEGD